MPIVRLPKASTATSSPRDQRDDNATYLPDLTRECEQRGLALQLTDDPAVDLPEIRTIDGRVTFLARADELGVALDELRHSKGASLIGLAAALPNVIDEALRKTCPGKYTPELATQIAAGTIARLTRPQPDGPLTAEQSTFTLDEGLGARKTAPVETELRDLDADPDPDIAVTVPWLAAQVVLHDDKPQAYGRKTRVWLHYGTTTGELTATQAREALEAVRGFIGPLAAVVALAEQTAVGDFEGDPEIARLDREAEDRRIEERTDRIMAALRKSKPEAAA